MVSRKVHLSLDLKSHLALFRVIGCKDYKKGDFFEVVGFRIRKFLVYFKSEFDLVSLVGGYIDGGVVCRS